MNDDALRSLCLQYGGSVLEALLQLGGEGGGCTVSGLARRLGTTRQVLEQATSVYRGRTYHHVRRSIEAQMGLSQYLLDSLLPEVP